MRLIRSQIRTPTKMNPLLRMKYWVQRANKTIWHYYYHREIPQQPNSKPSFPPLSVWGVENTFFKKALINAKKFDLQTSRHHFYQSKTFTNNGKISSIYLVIWCQVQPGALAQVLNLSLPSPKSDLAPTSVVNQKKNSSSKQHFELPNHHIIKLLGVKKLIS